jgi:hypothetical protein
MKYMIAAVAIAAIAPAAAQPGTGPSADDKGPWGAELELSLAPRLGREQPFDTAEELVDESEGDLSLTVTREEAVGRLPLSLKVGIASSPQISNVPTASPR